jgi:hypothetical protein
MVNVDYDYYIGLNYIGDTTYKNFTISLSLPSYVISYANYSIKYLIVVMDRTAISNDFPKYRFRGQMATFTSSSSSGNNQMTFTGLSDTNIRDNNYIMGLTQY